MGQKYVTIDNGIVQEPFDEDNNNVPNGALPITELEFKTLSNKTYVFTDFEMVNGALQLRAGTADNIKIRKVDTLDNQEVFKAFIEIMIDELNLLRAEHALAPRTMAQFKAAMRNKL